MSLDWEQVVVDAKDPVALGRWWADVLGWVVLNDSHEEFEIRPAADRLPGLIFVPVPEAKASKNRLHLDFRPEDQQAEVERSSGRGRAGRTSGKDRRRGSSWPTRKSTNSACYQLAGADAASRQAF